MPRKGSRLPECFLFLQLGILCTLIVNSANGDFLDDAEQTLTITAFNKELHLKLSGTLDLEDYYSEKPAPGLIYSAQRNLFNPRATIIRKSHRLAPSPASDNRRLGTPTLRRARLNRTSDLELRLESER